MVDAIARRQFATGERVESGAQLIQTSASWIMVEVDRLSWPEGPALEVIVEINRGGQWQEAGRFGADGGVVLGRDSTPMTRSSATFRGRFRAGELVRVVAGARAPIETMARLTWG